MSLMMLVGGCSVIVVVISVKMMIERCVVWIFWVFLVFDLSRDLMRLCWKDDVKMSRMLLSEDMVVESMVRSSSEVRSGGKRLGCVNSLGMMWFEFWMFSCS